MYEMTQNILSYTESHVKVRQVGMNFNSLETLNFQRKDRVNEQCIKDHLVIAYLGATCM